MITPITLHDVAKAVGVSARTVSRVVNGDRYVSARTRDQVNRAIARLGYTPNLAARSLVTSRSYVTGMFSRQLRGFYHSELLMRAVKESSARGFHMMIDEIRADDPGALEAFATNVRQMRMEGVILTAPLGDEPPILDLLDRLRMRVVRIAPNVDIARTDAVFANEEQGMTALAEHLCSLGHARFGIATVPPLLATRHEYFRAALLRLGVDEGQIRMVPLDLRHPPVTAARLAAAKLLEGKDRPTAIFGFADEAAAPMIQFALEQGLRVPEDVSIAGCDDSDMAQAIWPPMTTVHQPLGDIAREAVDLLLTPPAAGIRHITLPLRLVARNSTGPAPRKVRAIPSV